MRKTETETLAKAMDVLAREIQSGDKGWTYLTPAGAATAPDDAYAQQCVLAREHWATDAVATLAL